MVGIGLLGKAVGGLVAAGGVGAAVVVGIGAGGADDAVVTTIVDGDTLDVRIGGSEQRIRLLNIDTPESVDPNRPVGCLGPEATDFLAALLPVGTPVRLEYDDVRTDRYDRTLAGVFTTDGVLVNAEIARAGLGAPVEFDGNDRFLPPVEAARAEAEAAGIGLYSTDVECTVPGLITALDATVAAHPAVTPAAGAPSTEFWAATAGPIVVAAAATELADLLGDPDLPHVAVIPAATRATLGDDVREVRRVAEEQRSALEAAGREQQRAEQAETARVAEEQRQAAEAATAAAAEQRRAEQQQAEAAPAPERRADPTPERRADPAPSNDPYPGYTGPRCYQPGGRVWHPC